MTALYLERFMNYDLTPQELRSGRPSIGITQSGSDLSPCNRNHLELAKRVRASKDGAFEARAIVFDGADDHHARINDPALNIDPASQTPWQQIYRSTVGPLSTGACLELALPYRGVVDTPPRHNH